MRRARAGRRLRRAGRGGYRVRHRRVLRADEQPADDQGSCHPAGYHCSDAGGSLDSAVCAACPTWSRLVTGSGMIGSARLAGKYGHLGSQALLWMTGTLDRGQPAAMGRPDQHSHGTLSVRDRFRPCSTVFSRLIGNDLHGADQGEHVRPLPRVHGGRRSTEPGQADREH